MTSLILTALGLLLLLGLWAVVSYNGLVQVRNACKNAFSQIDVQLKRRYDLIPNLMETAKAYMHHERDTLEAIALARTAALAAREEVTRHPGEAAAMQGLAAAESGLGASMGRFWGLSESYPELRSNQNMMQLSEELTATENKISFARQSYNDAVMKYNTRIESFPGNLFAGIFRFIAATPFEVAEDHERAAVKVSFD
ncbi:MAG: LemA family protein [Verrucomicrobiales bacterium]|nr:LemA family protein [Verrucomicrobiales bacterium]